METSTFQNDTRKLEDDYDYSDYYDYLHLDVFGLCEKPDVKEFGQIFLPIAQSLICLLSIIGNVLFILTLVKSKLTQKTLPVSIAISDILFAMTLPFYAFYAHSEWIFGKFACKTVSAIYNTTMFSSIYFTICLGVERYLAVEWNFSNRHQCTPIRHTVVCFATWTLSSLAAAPSWIFAEEKDHDDHKLCTYHFEDHMSSWKMFVKFKLNIFGFLIPFVILLFCYLRVCCAITKSKVAKKRSTHKLVLSVVVVFFVLWFPYNCALFLQSLHIWHVWDCDSSRHLDYAIQITEVIAFSHSFINPILLAYVNRRVWRCFTRLCVGRCKKTTEYTLEGTNTTDMSSVFEDRVELRAVQCHLKNTQEVHKDTEILKQRNITTVNLS